MYIFVELEFNFLAFWGLDFKAFWDKWLEHLAFLIYRYTV